MVTHCARSPDRRSLHAAVAWLLLISLLSGGNALSPVLSASPSPSAEGFRSSAEDPYRLPRSVLPTQYTLRLRPDLDNENFEGRVVIEAEVHEATSSISLHAEGIEFEEVSVTRSDASVLVLRVTPKPQYEMVDIELTENLRPSDKCIITIVYKGTLRDNMYGFYVSTYSDDDGSTKRLAATQFQATHARKAFPCFDEPSFKARFQVSIVTPEGYHSLGNMPIENIDDSTNNHKEYKFHNSVTMSSYLLAFVVSDFEFTEDEGNSKSGEVIFKTWARPNALKWSGYSHEISRSMLKVLEEFTSIPFIDRSESLPLDKIDQVALPDFSAGAMENWGLITYRETALLYNDGTASARKSVAVTIAHELLHMWFGNLVTTYWWDSTWLNEGFARYFQYYVTDKVETEWRMWDQFMVDQHQNVFAVDALTTAQALTHYVSTPAEVSSRFSSLSYNKGASVLRMISYILGSGWFQGALQYYLMNHKYDTVVPDDLFDAFKGSARGVRLTQDEFDSFLRSWTEQPGFPVVNVKRDYESYTATLSQKRFLFKGESTEEYYVPLTWTLEGRSFEIWQPEVYLKPGNTILELSGMPSSRNWVIFNVQETGYYRVNYDDTNWELISTSLKSLYKPLDNIHVLNRAQLLDDALNLARASQLSYQTALNLADYLERENDYVPWAAGLTAFSYLNRMLVNDEKYPVFKRYVLRLIDRVYNRYDFTVPDRHDEKLLLNRVTTWACALDHQKCLDTAGSSLRQYIDDDILVAADLRSVVYCYGIYNENDNYWDRLWDKYKESRDDVERALIVAGLGCSSREQRLKELLGHSISGNEIRKQDASNVFSAVYANPQGVEVALEFLEDNFDAILNYYGSMGSINNIVTGIAGRLTTEQQKQKLESFIEKYAEQLGASGNAALETVQENIEWINAFREEIFSILETKELEQYRLPDWVLPESYTLWLEPDLASGTFIGEETINVIAQAPTERIILHAEGIQASQIAVIDTTTIFGDSVFESETYDEELQLLILHLHTALVPGRLYYIKMSFSGTLRNDMYGFYLSSYINENGEEKKLAATQFQPTYARRAFPCFDEPSFKATFSLTLRAPPHYRTIGNMPTSHTLVWDNFTSEAVFRSTPPMSTYLLAFVVSDFVHKEDVGTEGEPIFRTWARENALEWADYSLQVSRRILNALETFTGIPYIDTTLENRFDKVDQVALPDFSAGAMENWGLVTYRETALLFNDGTAAAQKSVATIIAHELAHMWFGNLVTTRWWDATWLNEGFAQYLMFYAFDKVEPSWRLMEQFVVDQHQGIFGSDSLASAAALTSRAYTPSQVSGRFGSITYSKGASVLRMVSAILGEDNFKNALTSYLQDNRYSSTVPSDLFGHLTKMANVARLSESSFENFLCSWTEQPGFPVITVTRDYESRTASVNQERFLLKTPVIDDPTLYFVPLTWAEQGADFSLRVPQEYLSNTVSSVTIQGMPEDNKWVIFNVQETGFYRVNYDDTNWKLLADYLKDTDQPLDGIHVLNRAQLLDDAFNLARAGQQPYATAFDLAGYLERETDYIPWGSAFAAFTYLQRMLIFNDRYEHFENYVLNLIDGLYQRFDFQEQEGHVEKLLLNRVSAWACSLRLSHCTGAAASALTDFLDNRNQVPANLRSVVYCYGMRHSDDSYWPKLLDEYKNSLDNAERALLMAGLACSHEEERLKELLQHSINGTFIRRQDASSVFTSVYSNTVGVQVALDFLDENFDEVETYYRSMGAISNIVIGISGRLTTLEQRAKMEDFVQKYSVRLGAAVAAAALETVDENLEWLGENENEILDLLDPNAVPPTEASSTPEPTTEGASSTPEPTTEGASSTHASAILLILLLALRLL